MVRLVMGRYFAKRSPHFSVGDGHFRMMFSDILDGVGNGSAAFVAAFACFIVSTHKQPGANETPGL